MDITSLTAAAPRAAPRQRCPRYLPCLDVRCPTRRHFRSHALDDNREIRLRRRAGWASTEDIVGVLDFAGKNFSAIAGPVVSPCTPTCVKLSRWSARRPDLGPQAEREASIGKALHWPTQCRPSMCRLGIGSHASTVGVAGGTGTTPAHAWAQPRRECARRARQECRGSVWSLLQKESRRAAAGKVGQDVMVAHLPLIEEITP